SSDLPAPAGLDALRTLTPADFDLVRPRAALWRDRPAREALAHLLAAEWRERVSGRGPVGFDAAGHRK
ncbi:MAG: hypothetical protein J2P48_09105, partial [Alphaproteobacteria bacterium]|nr:hypothetical protein [Alphaproteobacteria bacterium]